MKKKQVKNVLMVGCGTAGYYLAKELEPSGYSVKILEKDRERCIELMKLFPQAQVICGDAVDTRTLKEEGIRKMDACVSMTGDDRTNLAVSLFAHSEGVTQVLAKINEMGLKNVYVYTVEGWPSLETVMPKLKAAGIKHVTLMPMMMVAGDHANNDMAGSDPDSHKSQLEAAGYKVDAYIHGIGENAAIQSLYLERANDAWNALEAK